MDGDYIHFTLDSQKKLIAPYMCSLLQVFSQDKSIYEAVENAFTTIYIRKNPVETARNFSSLAVDSNIGDLAALEFIVAALVSKGDISSSMVCASHMWIIPSMI